MPGLTRRLLLAVLATLALAVAASPAGADRALSSRCASRPERRHRRHLHDARLPARGLAAAGTGMILTRSGEVLTNNHVIKGATKFKVVDVTTHRRYTATVVGYSVSRDIAVLQLANASGLRTVKRGGAVPLHVGMRIVARGNAQGVGGLPKVASGQIIALHQQIVATNEGTDPETLRQRDRDRRTRRARLLRRAARERPEPRPRHGDRRLDLGASTAASRSRSSRRCRSRAGSRAAGRMPTSTSGRPRSSASGSRRRPPTRRRSARSSRGSPPISRVSARVTSSRR